MTDLEQMAQVLEATENYRVLRRMPPLLSIAAPEGVEVFKGLFADVETTGLEPAVDEVIELAMVPFTFDREGNVYSVGEPFRKYRQPKMRTITAEITELTGITPAMVEGQAIAAADLAPFVAGVDLVVAHNATFDREFMEALEPAFKLLRWGCSKADVDWKGEGLPGFALSHIAIEAGFFYDRHRALDDCYAALTLLRRPLPKAQVPALAKVLEAARRTTYRLYAMNTPFSMKDYLKMRKYRWSPGENNKPKAWWIDIAEDLKEAEIAFLKKEIYRSETAVIREFRVNCYNRYSGRY